MKLEIDVGQDLLQTAATEIASRLFGRGGQGYQAMAVQAESWLACQDFSAIIQAEAERQLRSVVADVVRSPLQAEVKRQATEMMKQLRLVPGRSDDA